MAVTVPHPETGSGPENNGHGSRPVRSSRHYRFLIVSLAVVVALVGTLTVYGLRDDNEATTASSSTPTVTAVSTTPPTAQTTASTASTSPTATPTTIATTPPDTSTAVWPYPSSGTRYSNPVDAARGFAVDFVGFVEPMVGEFQAGDARSGEVEIRKNATGRVTTVLVRQLAGSNTWWVLGATTGNIRLDEPPAMAAVSSPVRLQGISTAFEATVNVEIREDGNRNPIGTGYVMGGSMGEMGPFDGTVAFTPATARYGAILSYTVSMEDGHVWEASVLRVEFAGPGS